MSTIVRSVSTAALAVVLMLLTAITATAATYTVTNTNDSGDGSLRQAILNANASSDNDVIDFNLSGCPCTITLTSGQLGIANNGALTINGPGADQLIVSGNNTSRVFFIAAGATVVINGITVTGGSVSGGEGGGGINNEGTLSLSNSVVSGNSSTSYGGGIYNLGGTLTIGTSTINNNSGVNGGAIATTTGRDEFILRVSRLTISDSTISANAASGSGGGVWAQIFLDDFTDRTVTTRIINSTISGNTASVGGSGVSHASRWEGGTGRWTAILRITESTISGNGIENFAAVSPFDADSSIARLEIQNTVLNVGTGPSISGTNGAVISGGYNVSSDAAGGHLTGSGDQVNTDPMLGPLQDNGGPTLTHALLPGSPAIDAGISTILTPAFDQRGAGFPRIVNGRIDIGAYESAAAIYEFVGFFAPVDNLPTINVATAGSAIPVKFGLGGDQGLNIFAAGYPTSTQIACETGEVGSTIDQTVNAGGSSLTYDSLADRYTYVWKTNKSWKGTCRMLVVRLTDGTDHFAKFRFR